MTTRYRAPVPQFSHLQAAMLAAAGLAAGLVYIRMRASRASGHSPLASESDLSAYLRDHLAGADTAIRTVEHLRETHHGEDGRLFRFLHSEFLRERDVVTAVLVGLGGSSASTKRLLGRITAFAARRFAGGAPGDSSLFLTLEALAIGVQGKRCLWRVLDALSLDTPGIHGDSFKALEAMAVRQWEAIDERRRAVGIETFQLRVYPNPAGAPATQAD